MCKEGEQEGERFYLLLQPRILEWRDSLIEVYEEFKGKLLQLSCNPPLTSHSPQLQLHKAKSHHNRHMPLNSTLRQPSCLGKEADLVLRKCSAVCPALLSALHVSLSMLKSSYTSQCCFSREVSGRSHHLHHWKVFKEKSISKHSHFGRLWTGSIT